jgi:3-hydroxyanthranilate 3,4-dioxygenase
MKAINRGRIIPPFSSVTGSNWNRVVETLTSEKLPNFPKFNLLKTVQSIQHELKPPVNNKLLTHDFIKIMVVGGPNSRTDYHFEMCEELFYQIKGSMDLDIIHPKTQSMSRITIKEGEMFLLPAGIPHSPQRYSDTIGIVFERERSLNEIDCLRWYHPITTSAEQEKPKIWYEEYFYCLNLDHQLPPIIKRFHEFSQNPLNQKKLSFYSNKDETIQKHPDCPINSLNNLFYSQKTRDRFLGPINFKRWIDDHYTSSSSFSLSHSVSNSGHSPSPSPSFSPAPNAFNSTPAISPVASPSPSALPPSTSSSSPFSGFNRIPLTLFNSEFVVDVYTGKPKSNKNGKCEKEENSLRRRIHLKSTINENFSKEWILFQYSGNSTIARNYTTSPSTCSHHSEQHHEESVMQLLEGEMMIVQDKVDRIDSLDLQFENENTVLLVISNKACIDSC